VCLALFWAAPDGKLRAGIRRLTEKATPKRPGEMAMTRPETAGETLSLFSRKGNTAWASKKVAITNKRVKAR
jgi:hypothetical protein